MTRRTVRSKRSGTIQKYRAKSDKACSCGATAGHYVVRCSAPDGSRPLFHLDPSPKSKQARERALEHAAAISEQLFEQGLGAAPRRPAATRDTAARKPAAGETLAEWSDRWIADRRARGLSSVDADASRLEHHVKPALGELAMVDVTSADVERLVEHLDGLVQADRLAWKTAQNVWGLVSKMFDDAHRSKARALRVRGDNATAGVRGPDRGARKSKGYLYPVEFVRFMKCEAIPLQFRVAVALAVYLFPRAGELEALEWSDVDLERGIVHIHRAIDRASDGGETKSTKTGVPRRFNIEPAILPLLKALHEQRGTSDRVIELGRDLARDLRKHLFRAGVEREELHVGDATRKALTFHDLRATGITWMAIRGDDPLKIMQRAGHTDFRTTQIYIREAEAIRDGFGDVFPPLPSALLSPHLSQDRGSSIKTAEAHGNRTHPTTLIAPPHRF